MDGCLARGVLPTDISSSFLLAGRTEPGVYRDTNVLTRARKSTGTQQQKEKRARSQNGKEAVEDFELLKKVCQCLKLGPQTPGQHTRITGLDVGLFLLSTYICLISGVFSAQFFYSQFQHCSVLSPFFFHSMLFLS